MNNRKLNVALIGGGQAFIAGPHQYAMHALGTMQVTCGVFSRYPEKSLAAAQKWPYPVRGYGSTEDLLSSGEKPDFAVITTPNNVHAAQAEAFLAARVPVFLEKPATSDLASAQCLMDAARLRNVPVGLAHTYLGYWSSWLAAFIVRSGKIGAVRRVVSRYEQGWLADDIENQPEAGGHQQAKWRLDPDQAGSSCCGGDIGTHAAAQVRFVTGLEVQKILFADARSIVAGRKLDDNFVTVCQLENGAIADISATQIAIGHKNDLWIEVNGETGTVTWRQEAPEEVHVYTAGGQHLVYYRGATPHKGDLFLGDLPEHLCSTFLPGGHPEGFHAGFSRSYEAFGRHVRAWQQDPLAHPASFDINACHYPTLEEGVKGLRFVEAALECYNLEKAVTL